MIKSPNLQISLAYNGNSIQDDGEAQISWSAENSNPQYVSGKFGKAYQYAGTDRQTDTNALKEPNQLNPANITGEFTIAAWVKVPESWISSTGWFICSFGNYTSSSPSDNVGIFCSIYQDSVSGHERKLQCTLRSKESTALPGQSIGRNRYSCTQAGITADEWSFIAVTRTTTQAYFYSYSDTAGYVKEGYGPYNFNTNNIEFSSNRHWYVGAYGNSGGNSTEYGNITGQMDSFHTFNTALTESDIKRVMLNLSPTASGA